MLLDQKECDTSIARLKNSAPPPKGAPPAGPGGVVGGGVVGGPRWVVGGQEGVGYSP